MNTKIKQFKILGYEIVFGEKILIIPIIQAFEVRKGICAFYCPYCKRLHYHGFGNGHRTAACFPETPFTAPGYIIQVKEWENEP